MGEVSMNNSPEVEDYLDHLSRILPWHRPFTFHEQIIIILIVTTFISVVSCILLCLVCSRSPLRRRYYLRKKQDREKHVLIATAPRQNTIVLPPPPPRYDEFVKIDESTAINKLNKNQYSNFGGIGSDSDDTHLNNGIDYQSPLNENHIRSQPACLSFSNGDTLTTTTNGTHLSPPFPQVNIQLNIDTTKNILIIHLTTGEYVSAHPAFDEQAEFFIHIQLLNNKILKKFHDARKKHGSRLQLGIWKQRQQEKTTKKLSRTSSNTLIWDEYLQFKCDADSVKSTSLRFLLFCIDRSGIQDLISEAIIQLNPSMIPHYQQIITFKDLPEITFGEIFLGISYLPTAGRFTIKFEKLRYLCKTEKDQKIDARLVVAFFHHGRRFSQKKLPPIILDQLSTTNDNVYEIKDIISQNIPQNDIQSIYVHFELIIHILHSKDESIFSCGSILLGEHTRYESDWEKMLEQPRQTHFGWYQFFG